MRKQKDADYCRKKWAALVEDEPEPAATRAAVAIEDEIKWMQDDLVRSGFYSDVNCSWQTPKKPPRHVAIMPSVVRLAVVNLERGAKVEEIARTLSAAMELVMGERAQRNIVDAVGDLEFVTSGAWAAYLPGLARRIKASLHRAWS